MLTFIVLLMALLIITVAAVFVLGVGGAVVFLLFGDVIVCVAILYFLVRHFTKDKK